MATTAPDAAMRTLAYVDPLSSPAGGQIRLHVSSAESNPAIRVVRLLDRIEHDGIVEIGVHPVELSLPGALHVEPQTTERGSWIAMPGPALASVELALAAWIWPTAPATGRNQAIITLELDDGAVLELGVSATGTLRLSLEEATVAEGPQLERRSWCHVSASIDEHGGVRLVSHALRGSWRSPADEQVATTQRRQWTIERIHVAAGPTTERRHPYNGKIESPSLFHRALTRREVDRMAADDADPLELDPVSCWSLGGDHSSLAVEERAGTERHGQIFGAPLRAVTSHTWRGEVLQPTMAPSEYAAIWFHEDDLADAGWPTALTMPIPTDLPSGLYAFALGPRESETLVPFVVTPPDGPRAPVVVVLPTFTYLAYANDRLWSRLDHTAVTTAPTRPDPADLHLAADPSISGSLYDRHVDGSGVAIVTARRPLLTLRPDHHSWITGGARHLSADLYLLGWLEREGHAFDVITDAELHERGRAALDGYSVVITGSHPEYVTTRMLDAWRSHVDGGGRMMYLGGNGFYWVTAVHPDLPHLLEVRRGHAGTRAWESLPGETHHAFTDEPGGLWRHRGRTPQSLVGVGFTAAGWGASSPYRRSERSYDPDVAFVFDGVDGETFGHAGLIMGGAAGDELDRADAELGTPPDAVVLASSFGHADHYQHVVEEVPTSQDHVQRQGGTTHPAVRADLVLLPTPSGGAVFSTGSIAWTGSLPADFAVSQITRNVLTALLDGWPRTKES